MSKRRLLAPWRPDLLRVQRQHKPRHKRSPLSSCRTRPTGGRAPPKSQEAVAPAKTGRGRRRQRARTCGRRRSASPAGTRCASDHIAPFRHDGERREPSRRAARPERYSLASPRRARLQLIYGRWRLRSAGHQRPRRRPRLNGMLITAACANHINPPMIPPMWARSR